MFSIEVTRGQSLAILYKAANSLYWALPACDPVEGEDPLSAELILYAVIAGVLIFWLRSTLGSRHGEERQRDNPLTRNDNRAPKDVIDRGRVIDITDIPDMQDGGDFAKFPGLDIRPEAVAGLSDIIKYDRSFDPYKFVSGAKDAFPLIVEAFAAGDTETLQDLLSPKIFKSFLDVIDDRKIRGETISTEIHSVRKLEIIEARIVERMAYITVRITANETCVIRDAENRILSGNPDRVTELVDVWTFGRDTRDKNPTWFVYETRDDVPEGDDKTPIPDTQI